jgi:hypothetical protein
MRIVPRLSLARRACVSNPAGKRIRLIVLFSAVAVASGLEIASASSGSFRGLLLRGLRVSGGRAVEALIPLVPNHSVATGPPAATLSDTQLNIARRAHTATRLTDGKVLIVGGENSDGFVTGSEIYDPTTGTFSISGNLNAPRADHTATCLADGRVLIAGGRGSIGPLNLTEVFDPTIRVFSSGPDLNNARLGQTATTLSNGRIAFIGGDAAGSVEIYDPQANTFSAISAHLLTPRAFHSAAAFSLAVGDQQIEKILIVGGSAPDGTPVKAGEIFDVASSTFSSVSNELTDEHIRTLLRVLPDGKVQIIGGTDHEDMEIYDPAANIFGAHAHVYPIGDDHPALVQEILDSPTRAAMFHLGAANALLNREGQTITELPASNQALVAGGVDASGNNLSSALVLNSSSASVTTDKLDYPPGTPVIVSGAGWQPHEVVTLMFHEDPHVDTENPHTFSVQTDADGNFISQQYAPEGQDAGVTYILAAKGGTSGRTAQTASADADTVGDYRSAASGNWNAAATWERFDGSNWVAAVASPTSADGVITIRSGHTVTISASGLTYDQVVVDAGGQVTVAATITSTLANGAGTDLTINGTWLNSGGTWTTTGTWSVGPGGTFIQNSTTSGFGTNLDKATLDAASNFIYRGSTGNVPSSSFSGRIYGNLSFENTSGSYSISASGAGILNVSDFTIGSGVTYSTSQSGVMTFGGNFTNDGTLTNGAGTQIYTFTGSGKTISGSGATGFETWNVNAGASITLGSNVSIASTFTGTISGTLNCGSNIVSGAGNFVLASGATLGIGDANGITSGITTSGNIQVTSGTRTFDPGARYTYNGSANQAVGNGLPSTVANLTIANTGGGGNNTVTGNSGQTVTGLLWVQQGVYTGASIYKSVQIDSLGTLSLRRRDSRWQLDQQRQLHT